MSMESALLEGLTDAQRRAVTHRSGAQLVMAGPGSGKTTVVTRRIALLLDQGVSPYSVLALTFTNKAAGEMRDRVRRIIGDHAARGLTIATFHAFAARQLRLLHEQVGVPQDFTIFDASDQKSAAKQAVAESGMDGANWPPASVLSGISRVKQALLSPQEAQMQACDFWSRSMASIYKCYQRILERSHALDFDDLLRLFAVALRDGPQLRAHLGSRFEYLMVDEYQDTNHAQFVIASSIAAAHGNICVVGDPDQSIYAWRGADITNILDFESQYVGATTVSLGQNFRSTAMIVAASAGLIACNESHRARELHTELGDGERPVLFGAMDEHAEAQEVVEGFQRLHQEDGIPWNEMVVLYRLNAISRVLEEMFRAADVPHIVARGTAFYQRKEIKDALSYLRVLHNQADDISLRRIVNVPARGIGGTSMARIERFAARHGLGLAEAMRRRSEIEGLGKRAGAAVDRFIAMIDGWQRAMSGGPVEISLAALVARVLDESGMEQSLRSNAQEEDIDRVANLQELVSAASERELEQNAAAEVDVPASLAGRLASWLESITLVADADMIDPEQGAVTLMSLHASKGLEFDVVAIVACEQGVLPHARVLDDIGQMEEERRLCYVGMTRARKHLLMGHANSRMQRGKHERMSPSRFLDEIPADSVCQIHADDSWQANQVVEITVHVGQPVRHPRFGLGRVLRLGRRPQGATITVDFVEFGPRTLPASHASLEPTGNCDIDF